MYLMDINIKLDSLILRFLCGLNGVSRKVRFCDHGALRQSVRPLMVYVGQCLGTAFGHSVESPASA